MIKRLSVWCAFGLLVACNNNPTREPQADSAEVITDNTDANLQLPDQQDSVLFNKLVVTGTFRQFQVSEAVGEMGWTGIFRNDTGYYAVPTQLFATRVPGAGGDTIDMEIAADNRDSLLVAVSSKLGLPSGYIKTASLPEDPCITAGKRFRLKFEDQLYELFATGDTTRPNAVSRYRLYISTERNGEKRTQLIGAVPQFRW
ncbi:hypothetical protein MKQ70_00140 [Chitinophaga sedimenti]|uniref:hypothetical protein n=1 Tax=Chitinophaga sedimenti TaxID=2033606 RepID=UPI002002BB66|nr:hypothetical protein [Chitinophaga sedimenti]MCK7553496.1 hypothetical protein [Chitinophaga sedimenti]